MAPYLIVWIYKLMCNQLNTKLSRAKNNRLSAHKSYIKIAIALAAQAHRFAGSTMLNSSMTPDLIEKHCVLTPEAQEIIKKGFDKLRLSMRGYHKILIPHVPLPILKVLN